MGQCNLVFRTIAFAAILLSSVGLAQETDSDLIGELFDKIDSLQSEIAELRDKNERLRYEFNKFKRETEERLEQLKSSENKPAKSPPPDNQASDDSATTATETALTKPLQEPTDDNNLPVRVEQKDLNLPGDDEYFAYQSAMVALQNADYQALRRKLAHFLRQYPNGKYAASAKYWIAETYYIENNYDRATHYYNRVINEHSDRPKYEDALLKIAYIRSAHKDWEGARTILQKLATSAKQENLRKIAQNHLERLGKEGH